MKKILNLILFNAVLISGLTAQNLQHQTEEKTASVVYFTKDVSPQGLMKVYNALNQKIQGNVGIKVSFGGPDEQVLDANLLSELVKKTNGTMFDANGLSGNRWTAEMNLKLAEQNGFGKIGIIASSDIVAVEQCAVDFLIGNADVDSATKLAWETAHQIKVLEYAEKQGNGNRKYQFVNLDQTSDTLLMSAGNKTFEIELKDNTVAREFSKFAAGKEIKMQKYGGFEFYVYESLSTGTERKTSKYEKGNIYYNTKFNAISLVYENHDLGSDQAILIGSFVDKSVCEALKGMKNGITFSFRK